MRINCVRETPDKTHCTKCVCIFSIAMRRTQQQQQHKPKKFNGNHIEYASETQTNNKTTTCNDLCPTYFLPCLSPSSPGGSTLRFPLIRHIFHVAHSLFIDIIVSGRSLSLSLSFSSCSLIPPNSRCLFRTSLANSYLTVIFFFKFLLLFWLGISQKMIEAVKNDRDSYKVVVTHSGNAEKQGCKHQ